MKPIVFIDIDGVLADFMFDMYSEVCRQFPDLDIVRAGAGAQQEWASAQNMPKEAWTWFWQSAATDEFYEHMTPLYTEADRLALIRLAQCADIVYLTERQRRDGTVRWLGRNSMPRPMSVVLTTDKVRTLVPPTEFAAPIFGIIDDKPHVLTSLHGLQPIYARTWPYNRFVDCPHVSSLEEFCFVMLDKIARNERFLEMV